MSLVLSGGSGNNDPNLSLGGQPSAFPITSGQLNNLFDDVTAEEASDGLNEYRAVYIFNDGLETVYNVKLWLDSQTEGGSDIFIGVTEQDEVQRLTILGTTTSGTITMSYNSKPFTTNFDANINIWAQNIQSSMNGLLNDDDEPMLNDVIVTGQISGINRFFDITYTGIDGKRDHPIVLIVSNNLSPDSLTSTSLLLQGSPVNTVAPAIDVETTPPGGVTFYNATIDSPINILKLNPGEGFPFWLKRTTLSGATTLKRDAAVLKIRIQSLNPTG